MKADTIKDFTRSPAENLEPLIRDLLQWVAREPRDYKDVMEAWKSHCPRLMIWEDAVDRGLVQRNYDKNNRCTVQITKAGENFLVNQNQFSKSKH